MGIRIAEPCHEDWDKMKLGVESRHCDSCVKSVVDFTQMERSEIISYILMRPNESVCGRVNRGQIDFRHEDVPLIIEAIQKHRPANAFMILALVTLTLASCSQPNGSAPIPKETKTVQVEKIKPQKSKEVLADKVKAEEKTTAPTKKKSIVEPVCPDPIMGIMVVEPEPYERWMMPLPEPPEEKFSVKEELPKTFAEKMPEYVGGMEAMMAFINSNLRFTEEMEESGLQGNVYLKMVVETDGSLSHLEVMKGISGCRAFEKEAIRVVRSMPNWIPGEDQGKVCRTYMHLPIRFKFD